MKGIDAPHSVKGWRKRIFKETDSTYAIANFAGTLMPDLLSDIFRLFIPVNSGRNRKLNAKYGHNLNIYTDTLFDYPTIIQSKLKGRWEEYNRFLSVQVGGCNFRCWYCYCDDDLLIGKRIKYMSAKEIVNNFLQLRRRDYQLGIISNVLRLSGGEPLLAPDLILGCLDEIKERELDKEIFVWSETNLSPLLREPNADLSLAEQWVDFHEIAQHRNFALHPCLHGITPENLYESSQVDQHWFEGILNGLDILIKNRIDIYPTFSSNTCPPSRVEELFHRLKSINKNLPLRFALIEFHFDYPTVLIRPSAQVHEMVYNKYLTVYKWDRLLQKEYGVGYAEIPRHQVPLS